jgi:hypothetical protein
MNLHTVRLHLLTYGTVRPCKIENVKRIMDYYPAEVNCDLLDRTRWILEKKIQQTGSQRNFFGLQDIKITKVIFDL